MVMLEIIGGLVVVGLLWVGLSSVISIVFGGVIALLFLTVLFGSWYTIDQGERGVILRNGAVIGTADPGLHFKAPWVDSVEKISVQQHVVRWICAQGGECERDDRPVMQAYSKDQQPADLRVSVNYHVPGSEAANVYSNYGSVDALVDRVIGRKAPQEVKTVFGQFNAQSVIQDRARFNHEVAVAVAAAVDGPVVVDSVQIENIDFSDAYEKSVEDRMLAEVEVAKLHQNAEREKVQAQITVIQAKAQADAVRAKAEAEGAAITIRGQAEAAAIKARAEALAQNANLILLTQAEKWNGVLPSTMVPGGTVPFLNVQQAAR